MATITTNTFLDDGVARTAGEAMTIDGGTLTVRTDTRWHANAPASMTGSLGAVTISPTLGGQYILDARNVRWMAFDAGSGTVPAIGTTITGGTSGASGYLLAVYASLTSAPTAVGAAMPATGFLKLREATAPFVDNDVLSGITATANGADRVGWIEVVHDQSITINVPRLGLFQTRGNWFELGTTTGVANQIIQVPTNGSTTTYVAGVWIETGVATNQYEYYPSINAASMTTTNFGTDVRSKFVLMGTDGTIRIGNNGTTAVGYVPPSGCRVRIPNILGRQCTTAARATNVLPSGSLGTRPDFTTSGAGAIDIEHFSTDWYLIFSQPYSVRIHDTATFESMNISECATALDIDNVGNSFSATLAAFALNLTSCFAGGTISNGRFGRNNTGATGYAIQFTSCANITLSNVTAGIITFARNGTGYAIQLTQSSNLTLNNCKSFNQSLNITTCRNITVNDYDYVDRYVGATTTATALYAVYILASSDNIVVDGVTFGLNGAIANVHPYNGIFNVGQSSNIKLRNVGTRSAYLSGGSVNNPAYIFASAGNNDTMKLQRLYMEPTRTAAILTNNSDTNVTFEHVYGDFVDNFALGSLNSVAKNCGGTNLTTGQTSIYGTHFFDVFTSDTVGRVVLSMHEPTAQSSSLVTYVSGNPLFTSTGQLTMPTVGDEIIIESSYFVKGCTALPANAPVVTGTNVTYVSDARWGNHDIFYQIDTGTGYGGTWKDLTATNLATETVTPDTGFKLKYRIVTATASATNAITYIRVETTSTLLDQANNLYPLDTLDIAFAGAVAGSRVRLYNVTQDVELDNSIVSGGGGYNVAISTDAGTIAVGDVLRLQVTQTNGVTAKLPVELFGVVSETGLTFLGSQADDTVYNAYGINGATVTGFTADYVNNQIDFTSGADYTARDLYAWYTYTTTTADGIRNFFNAITAIDQGNIRINNTIVDLTLDNTTATNVIQTDNIRIYRADEAYPGERPTTGGGGIDVVWRNQILVAEVSGGGGGGGSAPTEAEIYTYFTQGTRPDAFKANVSGLATQTSVDTILANQEIINEGVEKASKIIPHTVNL